MQSDIIWSAEQAALLNFLRNSTESCFVTGDAGTGKTTVINEWLRDPQGKLAAQDASGEAEEDGFYAAPDAPQLGIVVCAPTGIAALNLGGTTIHKFFGLPPEVLNPHMIGEYMRPATRERVSRVRTLVIDEFSMVRSDMLAVLDRMLQLCCYNNKPFGGVRMVFVGDLMQLPPVVRNEEKEALSMYGSPNGWAFKTPMFNDLNPRVFYLSKSYRQKDANFYKLLNRVRNGDTRVVTEINKLVKDSTTAPSNAVHLCTTNYACDARNAAEFAKLPGEKSVYLGTISGDVPVKQLPVPVEHALGVGARVMTLKNGNGYVNGSLGHVTELHDEHVVVKFDDGTSTSIVYDSWEFVEYKAEGGAFVKIVKGTYRNLPVRLAWAMTVHKSQGQGFDSAVIDMGRGAFAHGQLYVALSRLRTLQGMYLTRKVRPSDIIIDSEVTEFLNRRQRQ
jgi:hypothetical protein